MRSNKWHIIWALIAIAALAGGFFWGKSIASAYTGAGRSGRFAFSSSTAGFAARAGGGFTAGQVLSVDSNSLTLQLPNGNSENIYYSSSTQIVVPQPASISDVTTGAVVMVGGTQNSDGSMTAMTIQVRSMNNSERTNSAQ